MQDGIYVKITTEKGDNPRTINLQKNPRNSSELCGTSRG